MIKISLGYKVKVMNAIFKNNSSEISNNIMTIKTSLPQAKTTWGPPPQGCDPQLQVKSPPSEKLIVN